MTTTRRAHPWRRRLILAALAVLLGAVTTVGVTWAIALQSGSYYPNPLESEVRGAERWLYPVPVDWPPPEKIEIWNGRFYTCEESSRNDVDGGLFRASEPSYLQVSFRYGWPMRSLLLHHEFGGESYTRVHGSPWRSGFVLSEAGPRTRWLPLVPIPGGFALDTLFYAVPWWVLLFAPGAMKRWRRKRRGACLACGYDLRGLGEGVLVCPECGA